ncbi:hypothetical protein HanPSC8_Chr15g0683871 [Helianthus annuus]|nr:hypothetical protein HanPSC8_Chr15g0683871 [Helianthus annuus]
MTFLITSQLQLQRLHLRSSKDLRSIGCSQSSLSLESDLVSGNVHLLERLQ